MDTNTHKKTLLSGLMVLLVMVTLSYRSLAQEGGTYGSSGANSMEMIYVSSGFFEMGCTAEQMKECSYDEKPAHQVALSSYAIAKYPVTQKLWVEIMGTNPSRFKGENLPVHNVSWDEVQVFIQRLNQKTGGNYRLPTEAEWEYAARGGSRQIDNPSLYSGSSSLDQVGWSSENSEGQVHPVGMKSPNALGLYDMSGNVWEWCSDYYGMYSDKVQNNPTGAKKGVAKVARGGCYSALSNMCRVTVRKSIFQDSGDEIVGFRLAMSDDREAQAADAAKRAEQERLAAEKAAADEAKRAEMDRAAAEKEAADAAKRAEMDRVAAEKAAADAAKRAEQDRIAAEKAAADAAKRAEQDRIAAEKIVMHMEKATRRQEKLSSLQPSVFLTLNTAFTSMPQWSYGFKVGTVRVVGWYFSAMSNFNMRGAFNKFDNHHYYELTGKSKTSYLEGQIGLVVRPCKVLSLHLGAGFGYRTYNLETNQGWRNLTTRCYYGPTASLGVMFHIKCVVLSAEVTGMVYNFNTRNDVMNSLGAKVGVGFCLPYKK